MSKKVQQIECLTRLETFNSGSLDMILDFLEAENLISRDERKALRISQSVPNAIYSNLLLLSKTNKLQLLEYEWTILPVERIKITIITDRNNREFTYNV